jgi:hypothetical protein
MSEQTALALTGFARAIITRRLADEDRRKRQEA